MEGEGEDGLVVYARIHSFLKQQSPPPVVGSILGEAGGGMGIQDTMGEASV